MLFQFAIWKERDILVGFYMHSFSFPFNAKQGAVYDWYQIC